MQQSERPTLWYAISMGLLIIFFIVNVGYAAYVDTHPRLEKGFAYIQADRGIAGNFFLSIYIKLLPHDTDVLYPVAELAKAVDSIDAPNTTIMQEKHTSSHKTKSIKTPQDIMHFYVDLLRASSGERIEYVPPSIPTQEVPHIVHIQLESLPLWGVEHEPTPMPFLQQLMKDEITVDTFIANGCRTIDAEFATLCSFFPHPSQPIADAGLDIKHYCLPEILRDEYGYMTSKYHANLVSFWNRDKLDTLWGIDTQYYYPDYTSIFRLDDRLMLEDIADQLRATTTPQFVEFISFTSHSPHTKERIEEIAKDSNVTLNYYTDTLDADILERSELNEFAMKMYFTTLTQVDKALKSFVAELKSTGLWEKTILVITNDHKYYSFGTADARGFELQHEQPFVLHIPGMSAQKLPLVASHIDVAPTILAVLGEKNNDMPSNFIGSSIFDVEHPQSAINSCYNMVQYVTPESYVQGNVDVGYFKNITRASDIGASYADQKGSLLQQVISLIDTMLKNDLVMSD